MAVFEPLVVEIFSKLKDKNSQSKMEQETKKLTISANPHIKDKDTVNKIIWHVIIALLPAAGVQMGTCPLGKQVTCPDLYPYLPGPFTGAAPTLHVAGIKYAGCFQSTPTGLFAGAAFSA